MGPRDAGCGEKDEHQRCETVCAHCGRTPEWLGRATASPDWEGCTAPAVPPWLASSNPLALVLYMLQKEQVIRKSARARDRTSRSADNCR